MKCGRFFWQVLGRMCHLGELWANESENNVELFHPCLYPLTTSKTKIIFELKCQMRKSVALMLIRIFTVTRSKYVKYICFLVLL